jgi:hypothetical protein
MAPSLLRSVPHGDGDFASHYDSIEASCWMVLDGTVKAPDLLRFLTRLVRDVTQKADPRRAQAESLSFRIPLVS